MTDLETALERVGEDPDLTPTEKETSVTFAKDTDRARVYTAEAGLSRRLLAHPHAEIEGVTVANNSARPEVSLEDLERIEGRIVGVRATLPIGALQIKKSPREKTGHAEVVTDRVLSEGALKAPRGSL